MLAGLYLTIVSGCTAGYFVSKDANGDHLDKVIEQPFSEETCPCCAPNMLLPLWYLQYLGVQAYNDRCGQLWCIFCGFFICYALFWVPLISWLLGLILFRAVQDPGQMFAWGLLMYIILEFIFIFFFLVYVWFGKLRNDKEMMKAWHKERLTSDTASVPEDGTRYKFSENTL